MFIYKFLTAQETLVFCKDFTEALFALKKPNKYLRERTLSLVTETKIIVQLSLNKPIFSLQRKYQILIYTFLYK